MSVLPQAMAIDYFTRSPPENLQANIINALEDYVRCK